MFSLFLWGIVAVCGVYLWNHYGPSSHTDKSSSDHGGRFSFLFDSTEPTKVTASGLESNSDSEPIVVTTKSPDKESALKKLISSYSNHILSVNLDRSPPFINFGREAGKVKFAKDSEVEVRGIISFDQKTSLATISTATVEVSKDETLEYYPRDTNPFVLIKPEGTFSRYPGYAVGLEDPALAKQLAGVVEGIESNQ